MPAAARPLPFLETAFLRRSVRSLAAHRDRCHHCRRTPLVGERVYVVAGRLVCELCRTLHRRPATDSWIVHSPEHERAVRVRRRAA